MEINHKHYIGVDKSLTYNTRTKKVCPSDWMFTLGTLILILVPTGLAICVVIAMNSHFPIWLMILLTLCILLTLYLCLSSLYNCSTSDPGVIPSLGTSNGIKDQSRLKPDSKKEYYCQYQSREEL